MRWLTPAEARAIEPELACAAALDVPITGIIDQHELMLALLGDAEAAGATLVLRAPVTGGAVTAAGFTLDIGGDGADANRLPHARSTRPGLGAQTVARGLRGLDPATVPPQVLAKGSYFSLAGKAPFRRLIYPLPVPGSSGLHAGLDLAGRVRFGPDVEWVDASIIASIPRASRCSPPSSAPIGPACPTARCSPITPACGPNCRMPSPHDSDFLVQTAREHRVPGLINLYGIEFAGPDLVARPRRLRRGLSRHP